jgi:hypothetical protein
MDKASGKLTVYFEEPFWVGVFERIEDGKLSVAKVTFGAEPKDYEVQEYIQKYYFSLKFSPAVETVVKDIKRNPKRMQREARRQMQETGIGTKSQQVIDKVTDLQSSYMPGINIKEELKRILNDIYNQGEECVTETNEIKNYTNQILDKMLKTITNEELEAVLCLE